MFARVFEPIKSLERAATAATVISGAKTLSARFRAANLRGCEKIEEVT